MGTGPERCERYQSDTFFTICNYEQVLRDLSSIELVDWDLVILDEGQRIKNWESKTSNVIRSTGTPKTVAIAGLITEDDDPAFYPHLSSSSASWPKTEER